MLHQVEPWQVLQEALVEKIPLKMSYLTGSRWHTLRLIVTDLESETFAVKISPKRKSQPPQLQTDQMVGISFKYEYGDDNFIFDTRIVNIDESSDFADPTFMLAVPEQIEVVRKRSYLRVKVPKSLEVNVQMRHRSFAENDENILSFPAHMEWKGKLTDISAAGLGIAVSADLKNDFKKFQAVGLRFVPASHHTPMIFNAQVENILPTADTRNICLGMRMVGLEASPEGRLILSRLVNIIEEYDQMNNLPNDPQNSKPTIL